MACDRATAYACDVLAGLYPACKWVKAACARHLHDRSSGKWRWDVREAEARIDFFRLFRHYKGEFAGQEFELEPWQQFVVGSIYGWKHKLRNLRRFKYAYVEVPRKNGKTFLSAGIACMGLTVGASGMRPEPGSEVYSVATKEDQAKIVWRDSVAVIKYSPGFSEIVKARIKELRYDDADSTFRPLGADSLTLDGLNPYTVIMDELHAWPNRQLWDVITDGTGARQEPLIVQITTAGYNQEGICYEQRKHVCDILSGGEAYSDDTYFGIIYTIDEGDDPFAEESWYKANPNLGVSKSIEYMREEAARALQVSSKRNAFLNKQLDVWTEQEEVWLPIETWDVCGGEVDESALIGTECTGGLDLSSNNDITALVWEFRRDDRYFWLPRLFIPKDNLQARVLKDRVPYDTWAREGYLTLTPGDVVDYAFIEAQVLRDAELFTPREIAFDRWHASDIVPRLEGAGITMTPFGQGFVSMNPAMKNLEAVLRSKRLSHAGHPVLRWMMRNLAPKMDPAGGIKPDKSRSREKIDGIVAGIMAHGVMILKATPPGSKYEEAGITTY